MFHARCRLCGKKVAPRRFKKLQHGLVVPLWRIRDIDDYLTTFKRFAQSFTSECVDAGFGGCRYYFMATLAEILY